MFRNWNIGINANGGRKLKTIKRLIAMTLMACLTIITMMISTPIPTYASGTWNFYGEGWYNCIRSAQTADV